jgi:hypothetical protein
MIAEQFGGALLVALADAAVNTTAKITPHATVLRIA